MRVNKSCTTRAPDKWRPTDTSEPEPPAIQFAATGARLDTEGFLSAGVKQSSLDTNYTVNKTVKRAFQR
jgi:hypothetical protein